MQLIKNKIMRFFSVVFLLFIYISPLRSQVVINALERGAYVSTQTRSYSASFTRTNCKDGYDGGDIKYTQEATATEESFISQKDADKKAAVKATELAKVLVKKNGQEYANANAKCLRNLFAFCIIQDNNQPKDHAPTYEKIFFRIEDCTLSELYRADDRCRKYFERIKKRDVFNYLRLYRLPTQQHGPKCLRVSKGGNIVKDDNKY